MDLSIVILNYNVRFFLEQCLHSVVSAIEGLNAEIIVVDNNSQDDSSLMMASLFPTVTYIFNTENLGFARANNVGVSKATGKYICILNPDTLVAEDTFRKLILFAEKQTNIGIIGCEMIDGKGLYLPESKRGIPTLWNSFTKMSGLYKLNKNSRFWNGYYVGHLPQKKSNTVDILVGAFMFLKKDVYDEVGGFDESFFMYVEDTDLSYRVLQKGYINYYYAETCIIHYKGESTKRNHEYIERFFTGIEIFYRKYFKQFLWLIGVIRFLSLRFVKAKSTKEFTDSASIDQLLIFSKDKTLQDNIAQLQLYPSCKNVSTLEELRDELKKLKGLNCEIWFDGAEISNKEFISFIQENANAQHFFKIKPYKSLFFIGSNGSDHKGEVILLKS
ncbi:MAG: glycosyltransferase family 2 protein [Flavobacteriaceae bacterium]|nr:glycosyltransferase family 2 protein [Flavobacteriaceae bacterium]